MSHWSKLREGDVVDIVAPGFKVSVAELKAATNLVKEMGLIPRYQKGILGKDLLCAAEDQVRGTQLAQALKNSSSKMVWCLRGGYGVQRLLPQLARLKKPQHRKIVMGYSDSSALHIFLNQEWGWSTLHGPVLHGVKTEVEARKIKRVLFGKQQELVFTGLKPLNSAANQSGSIQGKVCGGNLTVVNSSLGTPWSLKARSKILVLEDIGERAYRIDRMLLQMKYAGVFKGVRALIFGEFIGGKEPQGKSLVNPTLQRFAQDCSFPVLKGLKIGHGRVNQPLALNTSAELKLKGKMSLSVQCGCQ